MKKNLLLLALLGLMLTGCGSGEKPEEISNDKPEIEVTNENAVDSELTPDEAYELSMQNPGEKFYFSMGERYFCNGVNYPADYVEPTDEENKQNNLKLVEEQAPTYVAQIIHDFVSASVETAKSNSTNSRNIKAGISYDDILAEAEAKGITVEVKKYASKEKAVNSIIEELMLIKTEELRAECEEKFIEVAKEEIENGKYAGPGIILWGEDAKKAVREILNKIDIYQAIDTDEEMQKFLAEQAATDNASVEGAIYKLTINGMVYEGTVDEIVDCLPSNEGIYVFTISEGIANSHYVVDSASAAKDAILQYVKSKANEEAKNNIEQQDSEDLHASVDKFIAECMTYVDSYLDNGYTITYYSVRTDDSKKIGSFAITSGDTTYLVSDSGIYNRVFVSNVDELNAIDKLSSEVGSIVWKEYNFGEKDWSAYMQELEEAELASKEAFANDKVVRQSAVDTLMEEKGYSAAPIGYRYYDTQILSILMKTDTGELYLYDLGTYKPLSNWSSRFNFSNEEEFCNAVSNNSVTDTFSSEEDYIWEIYEQIEGN